MQLGECKIPIATGRGSGDALFDIVPGAPDQSILLHRMLSTEADVAMPELGRSLVHAEGVALIREWIASLAGRLSYAPLGRRLVSGSPADGDTLLARLGHDRHCRRHRGRLAVEPRAPLDVAPSAASASSGEPIRSPFTQRREERATYLTPSDASAVRAELRSTARSRRRSSLIVSPSTSPPATPTAQQLAAMIAEARALANPVERRSTLESLLLRYAELDVDDAVGQALENDRETAAHLLAALTAVAPEQTWERAKQVTNPAERFAYLERSRRRMGRAGSRACIHPGRRSARRVAAHASCCSRSLRQLPIAIRALRSGSRRARGRWCRVR